MMRSALITILLALLVASVLAAAPKKAIVVSYPDDTPNHVLDEAKEAITAAGGVITHEYRLIKAFAAQASQHSIDAVKSLGSKYNALIEEDRAVHAASGIF